MEIGRDEVQMAPEREHIPELVNVQQKTGS
jgi:hypothetical protein